MSENPFAPPHATSDAPPIQPKKGSFTWVELVVVLFIIVVLVGLLIPARRTARPAARRMSCANNLKQIALALNNYESKYQSFPPVFTTDDHGRPLHSWRTLLLPFLEQESLYQRIDLSKPWNAPENSILADQKLRIPGYHCPETNPDADETTYVVIVDDSTCFPAGKSVQLSQISDGASQTIAVVELPKEQAVKWSSPSDLRLNDFLQLVRSGKAISHQQGFHVAMTDGSIQFISSDISNSDLRAMLTKSAGDALAAEARQ